MGTEYGYSRVSTSGQSTEAQTAQLRAAGCEVVYVDHGESSRVRDRPEWLRLLDAVDAGDRITVRSLDRIAGSERMLIELVTELDDRGVALRSLTEPTIDTAGPMGRAILGVIAVFVQLRVDLIRENTMRGLAHARAQGRLGGRPTVMTPERIAAARRLRSELLSYAEIARVLGVGTTTVRRALDR